MFHALHIRSSALLIAQQSSSVDISLIAAQDAVAANRGIGRLSSKERGQNRGKSVATKVTVEERRRRAAVVMVREFRKGLLGRLTFDVAS